MSISECRNDCWLSGGGWLYLGYRFDVDKASVYSMSTAEEGVYTVTGVDFVRSDYVLSEGLDLAPIGKGSGCSKGLHRGGRPSFPV